MSRILFYVAIGITSTLVGCSSLEVTHKGLVKDFGQNEKIYTRHNFLFATFRVPYAVLRYAGA